MTTETETAFAELLDEVRAAQARMVELLSAEDDHDTLLEAHKWVLSILQVAAEVQLWADTARPRFVEIVGPYKKWGGDNADAYYRYAPIDPGRTYRVRIEPGDAVYLSLTVYGGAERRSGTRPTSSAPSTARTRRASADGSIHVVLSRIEPDEPDVGYIRSGGRRSGRHHAGLPRGPGLGAAGTLAHRGGRSSRRPTARTTPTWPGASGPWPPGCASRRASCRSRSERPTPSIRPTPCRRPPSAGRPGDAAYAMGSFELADDEALVIRGRSPGCVFWNMCLWNPLLHTYNYDYERVTINGAQVVYEPDGSWTIVVAAPATDRIPTGCRPPDTARAASGSAGSSPTTTPEQPQVEVVPVASV